MQSTPHRKRVKHYNIPGHGHLLTFSCYRRAPLLTNDLWRSWLSGGIDRSVEQHGFALTAFVYMPEHLHLLIFPTRDEYRIDELLKAIKRPFSFKVKKDLEAAGNPLLQTLTIRDRPEHTSFRFWQEGGGHDRNLISFEKMLAAAEYIHRNPVRRGLCATVDGWKWSSWKFYHQPEQYTGPGLPHIHEFPV